MTTNLNYDQLLQWDKYDLIDQIIALQNQINNNNRIYPLPSIL